MQTHRLKCWPNYFDAVERGEKPFEIRRDDRGSAAYKQQAIRRWNKRA